MENPAVKRQIKLYVRKGIKHWGIIIICLLFFSIVGYTFVTESLIKGLIVSAILFIVSLIVIIIPFGIAGLINISNFKKLIRYQEKKYNITFDDNDFKKIQINIGGEPKEYLYYNDNWFVISGEIAFYYKEVKKSKRKRIHSSRNGVSYIHYITLYNNKVYKFGGNYKYYPKFKEWLDKEKNVTNIKKSKNK